jgi:transcriptional regulator with XRE-family HTH domain
MLHDPGTRPLPQVIAANLRRLRVARHLSLSELARATAMSKATLSGIENANANPTVATLGSLAGALQVGIAELLEDLPAGEIHVGRASHAEPVARDGAMVRGLDALASAGTAQLVEIALEPHRAYEPAPQASGARAHVYVVHGTVIAGPLERITELAVGDYASFPADVPHIYEAGRRGARALVLTRAGACS